MLIVFGTTAAACGSGTQATDDVARIASRTELSRSSITAFLERLAGLSRTGSDDLARLLVEAPATDSVLARATTSLERSGVADQVATGVMCDVLGEAALDISGLDREKLGDIVISNIVGSVGGDFASWGMTADGIANDISDGTADSALWARVTMLKLQHCM